ncbi:hypothetical protein [Amycolatopsis benzoatilytica]|uniref:hypothetical protein n=1 Tax=Amycolatopsis benzoatilytica TaxID=346045 RepID=UPI0003A0E6FA|nr:hypothetical protein [Amycolatopsis benzoatilytica]
MDVVDNQTEKAARPLRTLELPVDAVATSGEWGVAKGRVATLAQGFVLSIPEFSLRLLP